MTCDDFRERIVPIAEGEALSPPEEAHLASCDPCRFALAGSRSISRGISSLAVLELPRGSYEEHLRRRARASRRPWVRTLSAAAAALVLGVGIFLLAPRQARMTLAVQDVDGGSGLQAGDAWAGPFLSPRENP